MKHKILILLLLIFFKFGLGQNLVPNPSFEKVIDCKTDPLVYNLYDWFEQCYPASVTWMLAKCNINNLYVTPKNIKGFQYPHTGDNYIYLATYSNNGTRFYPEVKLKKNLDKKNIILDCIYLCPTIQALQYPI